MHRIVPGSRHFGLFADDYCCCCPSLPHDLPSLVVGAFKASLAELVPDHLYRLVLADAGRNHNPLLLQLVNQILRLPLDVFDHVVVICHAPNAFTRKFKPPRSAFPLVYASINVQGTEQRIPAWPRVLASSARKNGGAGGKPYGSPMVR